MIYLACYLSSCFFAYFSFRFRRSNKYLASVFTFFAILIPCFIAGIRDPDIGTDVNVYIKPIIESMRRSSTGLGTLLHSEIFVGETNGILFTILLYFCSRFKNGLFLALFLTEFLCLFPVYKVVQKQSYSAGLKVLALFSYYCIFYHYSLNLMKQCIAVAIILYGFELLKNNKFWSFIFLVLATALIVHKTAIIALAIPFIFILATNQRELLVYKWLNIRLSLEKRSSRRLKNLIFIAALVVIIFMLLNIRSLLVIAVQIKHSYIHQLKNLKGFELKYSNFLVMLMLIAPLVLFRRKLIKTDFVCRFYFLLHIISTLLYQFVGVSPALYRLSLYTMIFVILEIPEFTDKFKKDSKLIAAAFYVMVLLVNFMFDVILNSYAGVYPYSTSFFG